jgi:nucleoside-diphosphate-sugar epimerase
MPAVVGPALFRIFLLVELLARRPVTLSADSIDSAFRTRFFSSDKAHRDLGWSPRPFAETVRDTVTWLRSEKLID